MNISSKKVHFISQKWVEGNEKIPTGAEKYCLLPDQTIEGIKSGECIVCDCVLR